MPHLCPLNWSLALITFWFIFLLLLSSFWWLQLSKFPSTLPPQKINSLKLWDWK